MPFGLKNAGATYQRAMITIFHDMMHREIEDYVDDIVVKSKARENHFDVLRKVFERCRLYKLRMNPLKCAFGVFAGKFLSFLVHQRGIDVDPSKAQAIATMKPPATFKELKSFLGRLAQWLLQLFEFEIIPIAPIVVKGQAIADLLAWFTGEEIWDITDEVPGDLPEVLTIEAAGARWILRFDGSSTATEGGAGIFLIKEKGEALAMSFKLNFSCTNNTIAYKAYHTGLAVAHEMGIKRLRVVGDSNLVVCQTKGDFALKEPSLAPYRAMAQMLEDSFEDFDIQYSQRFDNRFVDALAILGARISFEGMATEVIVIKKPVPVIQVLKAEFFGQPLDQTNWRSPIKEALLSLSSKERLQRLGYYWPDMDKQAANIQSILPDNWDEAYRLKRMATRYFVEGGVLFRRGFNEESLRCLGTPEAQSVMQEVHAGECGDHQGKKRLL
ncbi:uncharacterized protein LOC142608854 [Castanea sativa]|uniref:uncharacterized protein LOC142608854 n=1 Tax=Castanea sativa TaxID=21020 RepID=UPI003F6513F8